MEAKKREKILIVCLVIACLVALGAIVGVIVLATQDHSCNCESNGEIHVDPYTEVKLKQNATFLQLISDKMMAEVNPDFIRSHLIELTKDYHPAGSDENMRAMDYIVSKWREFGLDHIETPEYQVLLSYPDYNNSNTIEVFEKSDWNLLSNGTSTKLGPPEAMDQQHDPRAMIWWNAYAKNGTVSGNIVYVNHCNVKDFEEIEKMKINVSGKIVLCRYGRGFRGAKVYEAETRGAIGLILYSDPQFCCLPGTTPQEIIGTEIDEPVFPNSVYMPPTGAQRGTLSRTNEDPLTPLYPAKNYMYRYYDEAEARNKTHIPNIPAMPIGYEDAEKIFLSMNGGVKVTLAQLNFKGGLNVTYYLTSSTNFRMTVNTYAEVRTIRNSIGYIWGKDEPDRYVLMSNHVDAWTYGAQDPNSGTAVNLEISRVITTIMKNTEWRPRRTIVFCGWDAEEYDLIGSSEWVEEKLKTLESRAVALLNVDIAVLGNDTLYAKAMPLLYRPLMNAAMGTPNPNPNELAKDRKTVYDSWIAYNNFTLVHNDPSVPYMMVPAAESDEFSFMAYLGAPSIDIGYHTAGYAGSYPLYHSMYEVEWTVANLVDQNFTTSAAMAKMWGELCRDLADSLVIPFNTTDYAQMISQYVVKLNTTLYNQSNIDDIVTDIDTVMNNLIDASHRFINTTVEFQKLVDDVNSGAISVSVKVIETLNSRLTYLERCFIDPRGQPNRPFVRHVVYATSVSNQYAGTEFAGVTDSLAKYNAATTDADRQQWAKTVNLQISIVQYSIESAMQILELPDKLIT